MAFSFYLMINSVIYSSICRKIEFIKCIWIFLRICFDHLYWVIEDHMINFMTNNINDLFKFELTQE